jgi:hypothetical protein
MCIKKIYQRKNSLGIFNLKTNKGLGAGVLSRQRYHECLFLNSCLQKIGFERNYVFVDWKTKESFLLYEYLGIHKTCVPSRRT